MKCIGLLGEKDQEALAVEETRCKKSVSVVGERERELVKKIGFGGNIFGGWLRRHENEPLKRIGEKLCMSMMIFLYCYTFLFFEQGIFFFFFFSLKY